MENTLISIDDIRTFGQIDLLSLKTHAEVLGGYTCSSVDVNGVCLRGCGQGARSSNRFGRCGVKDVPYRSYAPMVVGCREELLLRYGIYF